MEAVKLFTVPAAHIPVGAVQLAYYFINENISIVSSLSLQIVLLQQVFLSPVSVFQIFLSPVLQFFLPILILSVSKFQLSLLALYCKSHFNSSSPWFSQSPNIFVQKFLLSLPLSSDYFCPQLSLLQFFQLQLLFFLSPALNSSSFSLLPSILVLLKASYIQNKESYKLQLSLFQILPFLARYLEALSVFYFLAVFVRPNSLVFFLLSGSKPLCRGGRKTYCSGTPLTVTIPLPKYKPL